MRLNPLSEGAAAPRAWPAFDPNPAALLDFDFAGAAQWGRQRYKLQSALYTDISQVPGWAYSGSTSNGQPRYAETRNGILVPFGQNVPRITDRGLLSEEPRTNALPYSNFSGPVGAGNLPVGWQITGSQGSAPITLSPPQSVCGLFTQVVQIRRISPSAGVEGMQPSGAGVALPVGTHTLPVYIRRVSGVPPAECGLYTQAGSPTIVTVASAASLAAAPADVWVRYPVTFTMTAAGAVSLVSMPGGAAGMGFDLALPDLGLGLSYASTYISTVGAVATRSGDLAYVTGLAQILAAPVTVAVAEGGYAGAAGYPQTWALDNGANRIEQFINGANGALYAKYELQGADRLISGVGGSGPRKIAVRIRPNDLGMAADGVLAAPQTNLAALPGMNRLMLGARTGGSQFLNGYIQRIQILGDTSDSALVALSQ